MEVKKLNEIPMSAMWTQTPGVNKPVWLQRGRSRVGFGGAHLWAEPGGGGVDDGCDACAVGVVAGDIEADGGSGVPQRDQPFRDSRVGASAAGGNKAPGLTLGPFGQWFNRNETWAEQAPVGRLPGAQQYLLQQGRFAADVLYFYGEDSNLTAIFDDKSPDVPAGYGFDYINADGLIHELSVDDGASRRRAA